MAAKMKERKFVDLKVQVPWGTNKRFRDGRRNRCKRVNKQGELENSKGITEQASFMFK